MKSTKAKCKNSLLDLSGLLIMKNSKLTFLNSIIDNENIEQIINY